MRLTNGRAANPRATRSGSGLEPFLAAALLTLVNAVKPVVVDDTAYLTFARHLAANPLDPYGFEIFWYRAPEPAMQVLLPPVLPYWIAAGMRLFGEHLLLLKLWLFPFALALAGSAHALLRRLARGSQRHGLLLLVFAPTVAPLFNFMLDVPAMALGLTAVAVFARACDRDDPATAVAAGMVAGLAFQTKYTMVTVPAAVLWYGMLHGRLRLAAACASSALAVAGGWELWLAQRYGASHLLLHGSQQTSASAPAGALSWLFALTSERFYLLEPMVTYLGGLSVAWGLVLARALGAGRRVVAAAGFAAACALVAIVTTPDSAGLARAVCLTLGSTLIGLVVLGVLTLVFRATGTSPRVRRSADSWFLAGWLLIEVGGSFLLSPFPAARRVLGPSVVIGLLACRVASRTSRARPGRAPEAWITAFGVALGLAVLGLDAWDASAERRAAYSAARLVGSARPHAVWFQGHWGWQYYCERLGMRPVVPGGSTLRAGDWLVLPVWPPGERFSRPDLGGQTLALDLRVLAHVAALNVDDPVPGSTIPTLYSGGVPFVGRNRPRFQAVIYRVLGDWTPP